MPLHFIWISAFLIIYTLRTTSTQYCPDGEFTCTDGRCIEYDRSCDGREDCSDRIDEFGCDTDSLPSSTTSRNTDSASSKQIAYSGADIGLVIDSSMSSTDYENVLAFIKSNFLNSLDIGTEYSQFRVAAVTYGEGVYVNGSFSLDTYRSKEEVLKAILRMPYQNGLGTDTGSSIKFMRETLMAGARERKIIIVLTDGKSQENVSTVEQANTTRRQGYDLFAIGVGRNVNAKELLNIAGRHDRMFTFDSFDKLKHILDDLARKVGEAPDPTPSSTPSRDTDFASTKESETSDTLSKSTTTTNTNSASTNENGTAMTTTVINEITMRTTSLSRDREGESSSIATIISITAIVAIIALLTLIAAYKKWQDRKKARCDLGAPYDSGGEIPKAVTEPNVYS